MEQKEHITDMVFRVETTGDFKGTVFALFPHEVSCLSGRVTSYQHIGQHSNVDYNHCIQTSRPASEDEYCDLKEELESIGYSINVVKRQNRRKFLKSQECLQKNLGR